MDGSGGQDPIAVAGGGDSAFAQVLATLCADNASDAVSGVTSASTSFKPFGEGFEASPATGAAGKDVDDALVAITAQLNAVAANVGFVLHKAGTDTGSAVAGVTNADSAQKSTALSGVTTLSAINAPSPPSLDAQQGAPSTPLLAPGQQQDLEQLLGQLALLSEQQEADSTESACGTNVASAVKPAQETTEKPPAAGQVAAHPAEAADLLELTDADTTAGPAEPVEPTAQADSVKPVEQDTPSTQTAAANHTSVTTPTDVPPGQPTQHHSSETARRITDAGGRSIRTERAAGPDMAPTASMDAARSVWGRVDLARAARSVEASVAVGEHALSVTARHVRGGIEIAIDAPAAIAANLGGFERDQLKRELADAGVNIRDVHVEERQEQPARQRKQNDTSEGENDA